MSKYIDANALGRYLADIQYGYAGKAKDVEKYETLGMVLEVLDEQPTADVVSREQYNACYDQCLRLRSENEQLMDSLRAYEDDRK